MAKKRLRCCRWRKNESFFLLLIQTGVPTLNSFYFILTIAHGWDDEMTIHIFVWTKTEVFFSEKRIVAPRMPVGLWFILHALGKFEADRGTFSMKFLAPGQISQCKWRFFFQRKRWVNIKGWKDFWFQKKINLKEV